VIHANKLAIREYMKEVYAQVVADIENAAFGWLWLASLMRDRSNPARLYVMTKMHYSRLARIIVAVDRVVKLCIDPSEFTIERVKYYIRKYGLKSRERTRIPTEARYRESDLEIIRDTFHVVSTLHRWHYEKNCKKKEEDSAVEKTAVEPNPQLLEQPP
jgi:hypothetical protein